MELITYILGAILLIAALIVFFVDLILSIRSEETKKITFPKNMSGTDRTKEIDQFLNTLSHEHQLRDYLICVDGHYYLYKDNIPTDHQLALADHILINYSTPKKKSKAIRHEVIRRKA